MLDVRSESTSTTVRSLLLSTSRYAETSSNSVRVTACSGANAKRRDSVQRWSALVRSTWLCSPDKLPRRSIFVGQSTTKHRHNTTWHTEDNSASALVPDYRGRVKLNVLPVPSSLSTQTVPPSNSTSFLTKARPSPVPAYSREAELSIC